MNMMNKCAKSHKDSPSDKKVQFNLRSRARLNFRRRPILCTTLYWNLMQASNFGGTFDQLFLWIFYETFTEDAPLLLLNHGAKKSKMTKNSNEGGGGSCLNSPARALQGIIIGLCWYKRKADCWLDIKTEGRVPLSWKCFLGPPPPPPPPPLSRSLLLRLFLYLLSLSLLITISPVPATVCCLLGLSFVTTSSSGGYSGGGYDEPEPPRAEPPRQQMPPPQTHHAPAPSRGPVSADRF